MTQHGDSSGASREFLRKAREKLGQGDVVQASEKGWGAAAQMIKAIAEQRGWQHNNHARLYQIVDALVQETKDAQLASLFHVAGNLHTNLYENWATANLVDSGLDDVQLLVEKLESLLEQQ